MLSTLLPPSKASPGGLQDHSVVVAPTELSSTELSDLVLQAIVANRGQRKAASEWLLNHHNIDLPPYTLTDHLTGRLPELKEKMELVATLDLFSLMPTLQHAFSSQVGDLEPAEAARSYMDLMKLVQQSTSKNELNINVHEEIWHRAPRDLQRLFAQLEAAGQLSQLDQIIEGETRELSDD